MTPFASDVFSGMLFQRSATTALPKSMLCEECLFQISSILFQNPNCWEAIHLTLLHFHKNQVLFPKFFGGVGAVCCCLQNWPSQCRKVRIDTGKCLECRRWPDFNNPILNTAFFVIKNVNCPCYFIIASKMGNNNVCYIIRDQRH